MYTCIYILVNIYYIFEFTYMCMYIHIHTYIYTYIYLYFHMYIYIYIYAGIVFLHDPCNGLSAMESVLLMQTLQHLAHKHGYAVTGAIVLCCSVWECVAVCSSVL